MQRLLRVYKACFESIYLFFPAVINIRDAGLQIISRFILETLTVKSIYTFIIFCLLSLLVSKCKTIKSTSANRNLPVITDLNQLPDVQEAIFKTPSGASYILNYEKAPPDETNNPQPILADSGIAVTTSPANSNCDATGCPDNCNFDGKKRAGAKTTISNGSLKRYRTVKHFLTQFADLHPDADMPAIIDGSSDRVPLEDFNATIKKAWLFCYAKESDEDFHLVIGNTRNINASGNRFIIVEVGGLPKTGEARANFSKVQKDFFDIIGGVVCSGGYIWFNKGKDPIPITVSGSIYWDTEHWSKAHNEIGKHGPDTLKSRLTTVWEIHPITAIRKF